MSVRLLTEHHLEFLSLKGGCIGSSESTLVKMPHCWKSNVAAQFLPEEGGKAILNRNIKYKYKHSANCNNNDARRKTHPYSLCINQFSPTFSLC